VFYAICILLALTVYAYTNRIAPVACAIGFTILGLTFVAFLLLAGTAGNTRTDPNNAVAFLLIAIAFLMDGVFIAGAPIFGPVKILDVGISDYSSDGGIAEFWDGNWFEAKLPKNMSDDDLKRFDARIRFLQTISI